MFELLDQVIAIRTRELQEVPTRLDKERLKDFAQLDLRYKVLPCLVLGRRCKKRSDAFPASHRLPS
jgi:hypothetical protein